MNLYQHSTFIIFIATQLAPAVYANDRRVCDSKYGPVCCDGYYKDLETANCIPCRPGYVDVNCSKTCGYPTYGERCQKICKCSETQCDFSDGCPRSITKSDKYVQYQSSTERENSEVRPRLVQEKRRTSIKIVLNHKYGGKDMRTYPLITPLDMIGNESITLKANSNHNTTKYSSIPGTILIALLISSATLLLCGMIVMVALIRRSMCRRKENRRNQRALAPADLLTSDYDVLHSRNVFRGLAEISIEYSEICQSYSVNFTTKAADQGQSGLSDAERSHVYLDLDDTRK